MSRNKTYLMFIDESGESSLNHVAKYFVLGTVVIRKDDSSIIEGYLRLLKRKFLNDDLKNIHATDLFERPYSCYRKLFRPQNRINAFVNQLSNILLNVPYKVGLYFVDKDKLRKRLGYIPKIGRKPIGFNIDLPYELCTLESIKDFTKLLIANRALGEIIIESRLNKDSAFVGYFDIARRRQSKGGVINPLSEETKDRINSLVIANKRTVNGGLEIADLCSYAAYRYLLGDPGRVLKINLAHIKGLFSSIRKNVYVTSRSGGKIKEII